MNVDGVIELYMCDRCRSYYGSSSMPLLERHMNVDLKGDPTHSRARCPHCGARRRKRYAWIIKDEHVTEILREAGLPVTT